MIPLIALQRQNVDRTDRPSQRAGWRVASTGRAELRIVFLNSILKYDDVHSLFDWLQSTPNAARRVITLDFAPVRDIEAPWVPVFALLQYAATQMHIRWRFLGLTERFAAIATLVMVRPFADTPDAPAGHRRGVFEAGEC
jgi:hypothetical protein